MREHRPRPAAAAALAAAVALAGCGGGDSGERGTPSAVIPARISEELARASDTIARSLEAGDECTAAEQAEELRGTALGAVESGRIPAELGRPLLRAVDRLAAGIVCEPLPAAADDEEDAGPPGKAKGHDKDKGKAKGHDKDKTASEEDDTDEDEAATETTSTGADG